jgi:predicted transposase YdaD
VQEGRGPRPFDTTTRRLIEDDPVGWLRWIGLPVEGPVQPIDSNVDTVLAEVDKVLHVRGPEPWLAHIETQTGHDPTLPSRMFQYHVLLRYRDDMPVESTVVLLRQRADGPELRDGRLDLHGITGTVTVSFRFRVIRLWERPVEELLNGGIGVLPLAPISDVVVEQLPEVIRRMGERFEQEAPPGLIGELWAATDVLLGLRYDQALAAHLLRGVRNMRESVTYQAILEEGRDEGQITHARRTLLELGTEKLGAPDVATAATIESLADLSVLDRLIRGVLRASDWDELLATLD